jgi:hypothetical protein
MFVRLRESLSTNRNETLIEDVTLYFKGQVRIGASIQTAQVYFLGNVLRFAGQIIVLCLLLLKASHQKNLSVELKNNFFIKWLNVSDRLLNRFIILTSILMKNLVILVNQ